jgi:hypothetical protein
MIRLSQAIFTRWALVSTESLGRRRSVSGRACYFPVSAQLYCARRQESRSVTVGGRASPHRERCHAESRCVEAPAFGAKR